MFVGAMTLQPLAVLSALLAFIAIMSLTAFIISPTSQGDDVLNRLNRFNGNQNLQSTSSPEMDDNRNRSPLTGLFRSLNRVLSRSTATSHLTEQLSRADLRIKPAEWLTLIVIVGAVVGLLFSVRVSNILPLPIGIIVALISSQIYLRIRQSRRLSAFNRQLGDTMMLLSNALRAGYSFTQSVSTVAQSSSPPIGDEFARATREIALGINVDEALQHMVDRNQSEDFDLMVTAVQIQRVVGGNLAEILDTIAFTIRERVRIEGEIRTLTAQARTSGYIITALPIGVAVLLYFIEPSYFTPLVSTTFGWILSGISIFAILVGFGIIQRIVKIEV
ncbi:MAG: type II secretion system F family protein [Candidatus Dormibacteria bacterium]